MENAEGVAEDEPLIVGGLRKPRTKSRERAIQNYMKERRFHLLEADTEHETLTYKQRVNAFRVQVRADFRALSVEEQIRLSMLPLAEVAAERSQRRLKRGCYGVSLIAGVANDSDADDENDENEPMSDLVQPVACTRERKSWSEISLHGIRAGNTRRRIQSVRAALDQQPILTSQTQTT